MKRPLIIVAAVAVGLAIGIAVWAQQPPSPPGPRGGPGMGAGARGGGVFGQVEGGYVKTSPEAKAIWDRITPLETQMRGKLWQLFELRTKEADQEQINAKVEEIRQLRQQVGEEQNKLREHWVGRGRGGPQPHSMGRGQAMHDNHDNCDCDQCDH